MISKSNVKLFFMPCYVSLFLSIQCIIKLLLDLLFVISGIIKFLVRVSASASAQLIVVTSTLVIPDITKASSNNCLLSVSGGSIFACLPLTTQPRPIIILLIII